MTAPEPTVPRALVEAAEKALGCEQRGGFTGDNETSDYCLLHALDNWTALGCPVAVAAARWHQEQTAQTETERDALRAVVEQVRALAEDWLARGGPGSRNEEVFGPQRLSIEFVHHRVTALLPEPQPEDDGSPT